MQKTLVRLFGLSLLIVPICQAETPSTKDSTANSPPSTVESPEVSSSTKTDSAATKEAWQPQTPPKESAPPKDQSVVPKKEAWQPPTLPKEAEKPKESEKPKDPKMTVQNFFGAEVYQILSSPERVESFRMFPEPASKEVPANKQLAGFPIEKIGPLLTNDQIKTFQTLVLSDRSYLFEVEKRCFFRPDTGLRFTKGQNTVEILLSYSCDLWQFSVQGDTKTEDFDPVKIELINFRQSLFSPKP